MIKKISIIAVLFCVGTFAFAQAQPKAILSKSDIDNFVKNYNAIEKVLDAHEDEFSSLEMDFSGMDGKDVTAQIAKIRSFSVSAGLRSKLAAFGLGNNAFEKCMVILYGIGVVYMEEMFASFGKEGGEEMTAMIKEQINPMKAAIHQGDLTLITSRKADILPILEK